MHEKREEKPIDAMNFQELADAIADGEIMGTPTFNLGSCNL